MKKKYIVIGVIIVAALIAAAYFYLFFKSKKPFAPSEQIAPAGQDLATSSVSIVEPKSSLLAYRGEAIDLIGNDSIINQLPAQKVDQYQEALSQLKEQLSKDLDNLDGWLQVGIIKKFFNNYNGAKDAWEYAAMVNPENSTAYLNLANLSAYYLGDFKKAEYYYKKALERDPRLSYIRIALVNFYTDAYKEKYDQVDEVLLEGLKMNSVDVDLLVALANYYENIGDKKNAIKYFEEALALDPQNAAVQEEIEKLRK